MFGVRRPKCGGLAMRSRGILYPELAAGIGSVSFASTGALGAPVDFQIVSQSATVDQARGSATFTLTFDRAPNFSHAGSRQANTFQYEIDADGSDFSRPLQFSDVDAVIRGGEIWEGDGIPVR